MNIIDTNKLRAYGIFSTLLFLIAILILHIAHYMHYPEEGIIGAIKELQWMWMTLIAPLFLIYMANRLESKYPQN